MNKVRIDICDSIDLAMMFYKSQKNKKEHLAADFWLTIADKYTKQLAVLDGWWE